MSQSATKPRVERRPRRTTVQQLAAPQSPGTPEEEEEEVDVVPGRLTQTQWVDVLRSEDADDVVGEMMEEFTAHVLERCLDSHVHKTLVAFSVSWAKDFLVQALELHFMYRDEGDGPEEVSSDVAEDLEPVPPPIDSWAPGCVPVVYSNTPPSTTPQQVARPENPEPESVRPPCATAHAPEQHEDTDREPPADSSSTQRFAGPTPPAEIHRKKTMKVQLQPNMAAKVSIQLPRRLLSPVIKGAGEEGEKTVRMVHPKSTKSFDSFLRPSAGRQSMSKRGHHHTFRPPQLVTPQYEIRDTQLLPKRQTVRGPGLPISGHKYNRQHTVSTTIKDLKPLSNCTDEKAKARQSQLPHPGSDFRLEHGNDSISATHKEEDIIMFSGSLRLDTMALAPGVSLGESQGPRMSPLSARIPVPLESTAKLRPMPRYPASPMCTTQQGSTGSPAQPMPRSRRL